MAADSLLVIANDVAQAPNDKQQVKPMLAALTALPDVLGKVETLLADTGYSLRTTSTRAPLPGSTR